MNTKNPKNPTPDRPRAVIYLRQSTYREESISLELQESACRDYCTRQGYDVVAVEGDPGISGRTWDRPAVQRVMDMIEQKAADVIVLWKWSRLSRNRLHWALAIDRVEAAKGRIESATEPIDTSTASGQFARGVMTEYATFQSKQIGEGWEEVRQRRLKLGLPASGRLPYGWRWIKGEGIEPHPEQAPVVVDMYRRYLAGDGSAMIAKALNARGIRGPNGNEWTRVRPLTVLNSPIHAGLVPYRGQIYPGVHEGIIPVDVWEEYQAERQRRHDSQSRPRDYNHLLSNLMRCECGARMHGKGAITGGKWYGGYLCSHTLGDHPQRAYVSALRIDPAVTDWMMTFDVEDAAAGEDPAAVEHAQRIIDETAEIEEEMTTLTRQHVKGIIPEVAYTRLTSEYATRLADLNAQRARLDSSSRARPDPTVVWRARDDWEFWETPAQNRFLRILIDRIEILNDGAAARIVTTWGDSSVVDV